MTLFFKICVPAVDDSLAALPIGFGTDGGQFDARFPGIVVVPADTQVTGYFPGCAAGAGVASGCLTL